MKGPLFFAKILLFGEYGIIKDSKGLSIPYNFYRGALKIPSKSTLANKSSHDKLLAFSEYLKTLD
ncbi:MAG: mevalonate kinase, partial [Flavobacteriales bacterium]